MRAILSRWPIGATALAFAGCGGEAVTTTHETGGFAGIGGESQIPTTSNTGGKFLTGGAASRGGTSNGGGSSAIGATTRITGGIVSTGGSSDAGSTHRGGATGGGDSATGRSRSTGGVHAMGGSNSGGATPTGGMTATGGLVATGGATPAEAHDVSKMTASALEASLNTLSSQTGLPIYVTEYDVDRSSDADQLAAYQAQFPIFWQSSQVRGVTIWGWIMGRTWVTNSGLVKGTTPRPAMAWLMSYLERPTPP